MKRPPHATTVTTAALASLAIIGIIGGHSAASAPPSDPPSPASSAGPATSAVPYDPSERIVAVEQDGTVVVISVGMDGTPGEPFVVFEAGDDLVDGVALDADRATAFVGICCAPGTTHVVTPDDGEIASHEGSAPVSSPDRTSIAYAAGTSLLVEDVAAGELTTIDIGDDDEFTAFDVIWAGSDRLVVFGATATQSFELRSYDVASGALVAAAPAGESVEPNLQFVGVDPTGAVVLVDVPLEPTGPAAVLLVDPETLAPVTGEAIVLLDGVRSAALDASGTHLAVVDADGTLSIDGRSTGGEYRWAAWA